MSAWASWLLNGFQIVHFMPFYAQNYAQNYALIMQNYALVIMLYAQLCKRALLMHRTMTNYAHYGTGYATICPNYAQFCPNYASNYASLCLEMYYSRVHLNEVVFRERKCSTGITSELALRRGDHPGW